MDLQVIFSPPLLKALALTITVELLALLIQRQKGFKIYFICILLNAVTNLTMNLTLHYFWQYYHLLLVCFEIAVVFIEGFAYGFLCKKWLKGIIVSLVCNLLSWFACYFISF